MIDNGNVAVARPDPAAIRAELDDTLNQFESLLDSLLPGDWNRKSEVSAWSIKELLAHLTWSLEQLPREITAARHGKGMYNFPGWLANPLSVLITRRYARRHSPDQLKERFRQTIVSVQDLIDTIQPDEWQKGAKFYGHGFYSILDLYHAPAEHLTEHLATINRMLMGPEIPLDNRFRLDSYILFHKALRNDIAALCQRMAKYKVITELNLKKLARWFDLYCYLITAHHTGEDTEQFLVFARRDPNFKIQMQVLAADHHRLEDLMNTLKQGLAGPLPAVEVENTLVYGRLVELMNTFAEAVNSHLDREEAAVIKSVRTHFSEAEQLQMEAEVPKREGLRHLSISGPWMVLNLNPPDRAALFRSAGPGLRIIYELSWKKKFRRTMPTFDD